MSGTGYESYDKIVEKLKKEAEQHLGYASTLVDDGSFIVIINVVKLYEDEEE